MEPVGALVRGGPNARQWPARFASAPSPLEGKGLKFLENPPDRLPGNPAWRQRRIERVNIQAEEDSRADGFNAAPRLAPTRACSHLVRTGSCRWQAVLWLTIAQIVGDLCESSLAQVRARSRLVVGRRANLLAAHQPGAPPSPDLAHLASSLDSAAYLNVLQANTRKYDLAKRFRRCCRACVPVRDATASLGAARADRAGRTLY